MKKLLVIFVAIAAISFTACNPDEEIIPDIGDTTEVTNPFNSIVVPQNQEAFVLLTTATWCTYCGQWGIRTFEEALNGTTSGIDTNRINGISLHYSSSDTMYLEMSKTLKNQYGIGGPPNLWVEFDNTYNLQPAGWVQAIIARQAEVSPSCGIGLSSEQTDSTFNVYAKVSYFTALSGTYNLAIYAVQNNIVETQSGITPSNHSHQDVLIGEVTANDPWGSLMLSGASGAEDFTQTYSYTIPTGVDLSNIYFVAVVYEMSGGVPVAAENSNTLK